MEGGIRYPLEREMIEMTTPSVRICRRLLCLGFYNIQTIIKPTPQPLCVCVYLGGGGGKEGGYGHL